MKRLAVGLALSGGTAKSLAHIGVLKALDERGIAIDYLAGTSGGSIVAALYAAGKSVKALERLAGGIRWSDLAGPAFSRLGLLSSERIRRFIVDEIGDADFRDLRIPLAIVAADLTTGGKSIFIEGKVAVACRASSSIPEFYTPVEIGGHSLVDGSLVEHVPLETLVSFGEMFAIGVNLGHERGRAKEPRNILQLATLITDFIAQRNAAVSERLADFMIHPRLEEFSPFALNKASDLIEKGYREAKAGMDDLETALEARRSGPRDRRHGTRRRADKKEL